MSWNRTLQILKFKLKIKSLICLSLALALMFALTGCSVLDFDKNKNTYITDPNQLDGLMN